MAGLISTRQHSIWLACATRERRFVAVSTVQAISMGRAVWLFRFLRSAASGRSNIPMSLDHKQCQLVGTRPEIPFVPAILSGNR